MIGNIISAIFLLILQPIIYLIFKANKKISSIITISKTLLKPIDLNEEQCIKNFMDIINIKTESYSQHKYNIDELAHFIEVVKQNHPLLFNTQWIQFHTINNYSLLFKCVSDFEEENPDHDFINDMKYKPYMFIAHSDVVPAPFQDENHKSIKNNNNILINDNLSHKNNSKDWKCNPYASKIFNVKKTVKESSNDGDLKDDVDEVAYIYGRGTLDAKHIMCSLFATLEYMIEHGLRPKFRSFFLAFGHDEEVNGLDGALNISKFLHTQYKIPNDHEITEENIWKKPLAFIVDEGTSIYCDVFKSMPQLKIGVIGISEKISCMLKMTVKTEPGHSSLSTSQPQKALNANKIFPLSSSTNAIAILSSGLARLDAHTFARPHRWGFSLSHIFDSFIPYIGGTKSKITNCTFFQRIFERVKALLLPIFLANCDICSGFIIKFACKYNSLVSSLFGTVACITMIKGGLKDNIVPSEAQATVNIRVYPTQTISEIMTECENVIGDKRVHLEAESTVPHIPISNCCDTFTIKSDQTVAIHTDDEIPLLYTGYYYLRKTIGDMFEQTPVVPIILPGGTDSKHFINLTLDIYRFSPVVMPMTDIKGIHGINERIRVKSYMDMIRFYIRFIENTSGFVQYQT